MSDIIREETAHSINGVKGRLSTLCRPPAPWKAGTFANQKWLSESRPIPGYGKGAVLTVEMRFDDNCKNGHNDFAITAHVETPASRRRNDWEACGCLHADIAEVFPELAHLIRWHLCSTDSLMHYVANTVYLAGDRDYNGRRKGEVSAYEHGIKFGNSPMFHKLGGRFREWLLAAEKFNASALKTNPAYVHFEPVAVQHKKEPGAYEYDPKYTFKGYECEWYQCPFDSLDEANRFAQALKLPHEFVSIPTAFSKGKERDFNAARSCGVWPDATDEELSVDRDTLKAKLEARLPALLAAFRADIEAIGFMWECPTLDA